MSNEETSQSLLLRLRDYRNADAWSQFNQLYGPFIEGWLIRRGVPRDISEDVRQEVMTKVVQEISAFSHNGRTGAFRKWLKQITHFRLRTTLRQRWKIENQVQQEYSDLVDQLGADDSAMSRLWDAEHDAYLVQRILEMVQRDFTPQTIQIFQRVVLDAEDAQSIASDLQITVNAVRIAQSRVLAALRRIGAGLLY